jgi:anthranilate phosphoribosyltransferase
MAEVLGRLGAKHIMVVNSADGLDEISIAAETYVAEFKDGEITDYSIKPEDFFNCRQSLEGLSVSDAKQSFAIISDALSKQQGDSAEKAADLIAINAGAALYVAGCAADLQQGVAMAQDAIKSGLAKTKISDFAAFTRAQADS